jgi:hypothetical protein
MRLLKILINSAKVRVALSGEPLLSREYGGSALVAALRI